MLSIVVPFFNEEKILRARAGLFKELAKHSELLFVDGESSDRSAAAAGECGTVLSGRKGRAAQMNCGAASARNNILLFLHADNMVEPHTLAAIEKKMQGAGIVGGCLTQAIEKKGIIYRLIEGQGNLRAKASRVFYGDQGIFVRKDIFFQLGGFPDVPVMEDILFTKKMRQYGSTAVLPEQIFVSGRRWEQGGILKTALLYNLMLLLFWLKCPLSRIRRLYEDLR